VHLLVELGCILPLGRAVARLKSRIQVSDPNCQVAWQAGYFDHRLRPKEDLLPFYFYIYLNPYRAGLIPAGKSWPWILCHETDRAWFMPLLGNELPEPAWLAALP